MMNSTVIVIGAGASKPYGLPLGWELRDKVIALLRNDSFGRLCEEAGHSRSEYEEFAKALSNSGERSVDAFLERVPKWTELGKLGIAFQLASLEHPHKLFPPHQPKRDHWLETIWARIRQDTWRKQRNLRFRIVTFNYDRIVEHYLATVIRSAFGVSPEAINQYIGKQLVIHVHGSLGSYTHRTFDIGSRKWKNAIEAVHEIKIIHELKGLTNEFACAQKALQSAKRVLFIGFGYHPNNMARLNAKRLREEDKTKIVFGTHKGMGAAHWSKVCDEYRFSEIARRFGSGSISDFLNATMDT